MNHLVVLAHPRTESFNHLIKDAYVLELEKRGHEVAVRDLYASGFNPVLSAADFVAIERGHTPPDIAAEQECIDAAEVVTFISPIWWMSLPAMLKGYFDRVFSHDFAYSLEHGEFRGLLGGKQAVVINTCASTLEELARSGAVRAVETIEDQAIITASGMQILKHLYFAPLAPGRTSRIMIEDWLEEVRGFVNSNF